MSRIQEGSVVSLNSGGPTMTVSSQPGQNLCVCHWFVGDTIQEFTFNENELSIKDTPGNDIISGSVQIAALQSSYSEEEYGADVSQPLASYADVSTEEDNISGGESGPEAAAADSSMAIFPQTNDNTGMADSIVAEAQKISDAAGG